MEKKMEIFNKEQDERTQTLIQNAISEERTAADLFQAAQFLKSINVFGSNRVLIISKSSSMCYYEDYTRVWKDKSDLRWEWPKGNQVKCFYPRTENIYLGTLSEDGTCEIEEYLTATIKNKKSLNFKQEPCVSIGGKILRYDDSWNFWEQLEKTALEVLKERQRDNGSPAAPDEKPNKMKGLFDDLL